MLKDMKIGVTGGSGFLGRHLLHMLDDASHLDLLARKSSRFSCLPSAANIVSGDCVTGEGLTRLAKNKDALVHMAFMLFGANWRDYFQTNIKACQNLVRAVNNLPPRERPKKIIFVSSLAAAGPCGELPGINEKSNPAPVSAYGWSKLTCENILSSAFGPDCVILRPAIIYGSGDRGLLPMFRAAGKGIGISPGIGREFPVSAIHAADAARAILLLCQNDAQGIYHLDDGNAYTMTQFSRAMAAAQNRENCRIIKMPLPCMKVSAAFSTLFANILKKFIPGHRLPQWNMDKYYEARQEGWLSDSSRIRAELGFNCSMSLAEGMKEAVQGYRAMGML